MPANLTCLNCGLKTKYSSNKGERCRLICVSCDGTEFSYNKQMVEIIYHDFPYAEIKTVTQQEADRRKAEAANAIEEVEEVEEEPETEEVEEPKTEEVETNTTVMVNDSASAEVIKAKPRRKLKRRKKT